MATAPHLVRNSSSAAKDNILVYWCSPKGELQPAPDGRISQKQMEAMPEYRHWKRCEAVGAREIEKVSLIISRQLFEKKKQMKVQQHLREKLALDQLVVRCKLRLAQDYSKNDVETNALILKRAQKNEDDLMRLICSEFDPGTRTSALSIEVKEQSTSPLAHVGQKPQGVIA